VYFIEDDIEYDLLANLTCWRASMVAGWEGMMAKEYAKQCGIDAARCEPLTRPRGAEKNPHFVLGTGSL